MSTRKRSTGSCRNAIRWSSTVETGRSRHRKRGSSRWTRRGHPALFQIGANALGFTGHPGVKAAIIEDLIMEFEEAPADPGPTLARLREVQTALEDALVPIMTGVVRILRLMD